MQVNKNKSTGESKAIGHIRKIKDMCWLEQNSPKVKERKYITNGMENIDVHHSQQFLELFSW